MPEFNPYHEWLGIPPRIQRPNHYQLLGITRFEDNPKVIENAADRQMAHLRTFQSGKHSAKSQRLLNEVSTARVCLLQPDEKAAYDAQLRAELSVRQPDAAPSLPVPADRNASAAYPVSASSEAFPGSANVIDSYVIREPASIDFRSGRSNIEKKRKGRGQTSGNYGPRIFAIALFAVGVVGLAALLWVRSNKGQIQVAKADRAAAAKQQKNAKKSAPAKNSTTTQRNETEAALSSDNSATKTPITSKPVPKREAIVPKPPNFSGPSLTASSPASSQKTELSAPNLASTLGQHGPSFDAEWVLLTPKEMSSSVGSTFELEPDGAIFVSGPTGKGSYTVKAESNLTGITAVRLEALADVRLPFSGPGRASLDGNFVLSELKITATSIVDSTERTEVLLQNALADFSQDKYPVTAAIDGDPNTGWAIKQGVGSDHIALFEMSHPAGFVGGTEFTFVLHFNYAATASAGHFSLGKFRLAIAVTPTEPR